MRLLQLRSHSQKRPILGKGGRRQFTGENRIPPGSCKRCGSFATQSFKAGGTVFCEKAFGAATPQMKPAHLIITGDGQLDVGLVGKYDVAMWKNLVDKVARKKSTAERLDELADTDCMTYTAPSIGADEDLFLMYKNSLGSGHMITHSASTSLDKEQGLFIHGSQMNHSCMPNTDRAFLGDLLIVHASRTIQAGEQLFGSRTQLFDDYEQTKIYLGGTPKGHCECGICVAEQQTSSEQRVIRRETLASVAAFCATVNSLSKLTPKAQLENMVKKGVHLAKKLSATYDDDTFHGSMPRRGLVTLYTALQNIHSLEVQRQAGLNPTEMMKSLKFAMQAIRAQGCALTVNTAGNVSFENLFGVDNEKTERLLFMCASIASSYARYKTAKQFLGFAKELYLLENCDLKDFPKDLAWLDALPI